MSKRINKKKEEIQITPVELQEIRDEQFAENVHIVRVESMTPEEQEAAIRTGNEKAAKDLELRKYAAEMQAKIDRYDKARTEMYEMLIYHIDNQSDYELVDNGVLCYKKSNLVLDLNLSMIRFGVLYVELEKDLMNEILDRMNQMDCKRLTGMLGNAKQGFM